MANPMLQQLSQQQNSQPMMHRPNNPMHMIQQFQQFKQSLAGKDPHQMVDQLVQSGKMTPQQRDSLVQQAQSMLSMFRR